MTVTRVVKANWSVIEIGEGGFVFGRSVNVGGIDLARLANDLRVVLTELEADGFEVVSILPITSGLKGIETLMDGGPEISYSFGFTEGLIVVARK